MELEIVFFGAVRLFVVAASVALLHRLRPFARRRGGNSRRGRKLTPNRAQRRAEKKALGKNRSGLPFGGRTLPESAATSHFLVLGTTGSGKTLTISALMAKALGGIEVGSNRRALVYDAKQDVLSALSALRLSCEVVTLNPFDARSAAWDIASDVTAPAVALQVAANHIPEESGSNRFFSDAARDLFCGAMLSFAQANPNGWTYRDLILACSGRRRLEAVLERSAGGRNLLEVYFSEERTLSGVLATLRSRLAPFEPVAALWSRAERKVSLREWARGEFVLVLGNDEQARCAIDSVNRVLFQRAGELLLAQSESAGRRSWLFLDEVAEAGALPGLPRLMNKGRSKGVCVVLGVQELASLKEAYGENGAAVLASNANSKVLLRVESPESAEWASKMLGEYEEIEIMRGESLSGLFGFFGQSLTHSEQRVRGSAVLASEFFSIPQTNRDNGLTGYFLTPHLGAFRATIPARVIDTWLPCKKSDARREPDFVPRPEREQYLAPWNEFDAQRLSLRLELGPINGTELGEVLEPAAENLPEELVH